MRPNRLAVVATAAALASACEDRKPATSEPGTHAAAPAPAAPSGEGDVVLFGEVGSLTGSEAMFGVQTQHGIELAVKEINAAGGVKGRKIKVIVYDDQSKPEEARSAVTRLIVQDKVHLVLGEVASTNSLQMAPVCQQNQVPMITPSSTNPKVTEIGDYIFRVCFIDPFQGEVMAKFAREHLKLAKVAVFKDVRCDYCIGLAEYFTAKFKALGGQVVLAESYSKGDSDFRAQLTKIRGAKPDGVFVPGYYNDVGLVAKQARQLGLKATLLGGDGWEPPEKLYELGGSAIDGSYYSTHYSTDDPTPRVRQFIEAYRSAYGGEAPSGLAALGYDAARVAAAAVARAKDLTGPSLRDAIAATRDFDGVTGKISLDAKRNAVKPAVVLKLEGGKTTYVTTLAP